jgi:hypothetical protein
MPTVALHNAGAFGNAKTEKVGITERQAERGRQISGFIAGAE